MRLAARFFAGLLISILWCAAPGESRTLATCTPIAHAPFPVNNIATGVGTASCQQGAPGYAWDVRLYNAAGGTIRRNTGTGSGTKTWYTTPAYCFGQQVKSFLYLNVAGAGKSDTSGLVGC